MRFFRQSVAPLLAAACLPLSGCAPDAESRSLKLELADLKTTLAETDRELALLRDSYAAALAREEALHADLKDAQISAGRLQIKNQSLEEKFQEQENRLGSILRDVESAHEKHQEEIEALRKEFEDYKRKYRISLRLRSPGTELPDLEYCGTSYSNPVVVFATPAWLEIRHDSGIANLDFAFLPHSLRERFGYHPDEAAEFIKIEKGNRFEALANHLAAKDQEAALEHARKLRVIYVAWQNKLARTEDQIRRKEAEIRATKRQLQQTSSRSSGAARLRNDIERLSRDLEFLRRDHHLITLEEPFNPDAN